MTILTLLALLLAVMMVASAFPAPTPPPPQVILVQASEPAGSTGCLPLILLVVAVTLALTVL